MSAFVVSDETLRGAVLGFATVMRQYGNSFTAKETAANPQRYVLDKDVLNQIARDFHALNVRAVNGRYNENEDTSLTVDLFKEPELYFAPFFLGDADRKGAIENLKCLACLRYQCAEDATINDPLFAMISEGRSALAVFVAESLDDYKTAPRWW